MELCKEAGAWNQIVVHEHCSMDPASRGMQVGRIHGLGEAAVGPEEARMEPRREVAHGKVAGAAADVVRCKEVSCKEEGQGDHIQPWQVAPKAGSMALTEDEYLSVVVNWTSEPDGLREDSCRCCTHL